MQTVVTVQHSAGEIQHVRRTDLCQNTAASCPVVNPPDKLICHAVRAGETPIETAALLDRRIEGSIGMKVSEHANLQAPETMIPVLPCLDPDATLGFFQVLGFEVTYRMTKPYLYLALRKGTVEVHFGTGSSAIDPNEEITGGCLVMVDAVEPYHRAFSEAMRAQYGRVLAKGRPRITRYRSGQTRFSIIDPSGNTLIFIERDEPALEYGGSSNLKGLARSIDSARVFREFKNDDGMAAKVLDAAIALVSILTVLRQ